MIKTKADIEQDVFNVANSYFGASISGKVYKEDCRPKDSKLEDVIIVISFATADQFQAGSVYVNIFVPDLHTALGEYLPDKARLSELASMDEGLVTALNKAYTDYDFQLGSATDILRAQNVEQYIASINLTFKRTTF